MTVRLLVGDSTSLLAGIAADSIQTVVTSPPYFGLRDYGVAGQMGLEATPGAYLERMVALFRQVHRVLHPSGTLWLNMGDSYARTGGTDRQITSTGKVGSTLRTLDQLPNRKQAAPAGLKDKDLVGMPWRLAFALQADGWYLRQDIVWSKPNPMPESVTDRCTKAHEYLFLLSKSPRYYFNQAAIAEPVSDGTHARMSQDVAAQRGSDRAHAGGKTNGRMKAVLRGTAARLPGIARPAKGMQAGLDGDVTHRTKAGLFAYAERQRVAAGVNPKAAQSAPGSKQNASFSAAISGGLPSTRNKRSVWTIATEAYRDAHFATFPTALVEPCILAGSRPGDTVLDPFGGAGTTGLVADRLQRHAVLVELNPKYAAMARERIRAESTLLADVVLEETAR